MHITASAFTRTFFYALFSLTHDFVVQRSSGFSFHGYIGDDKKSTRPIAACPNGQVIDMFPCSRKDILQLATTLQHHQRDPFKTFAFTTPEDVHQLINRFFS
jgi:hypothetical protein